jgi:hypothetical protein
MLGHDHRNAHRAPEAQRAAILAVLRQEGFMQREQPQ